MTALVTQHFRIHQAIQFFESFDEDQSTRYYYYIGKNYASTNATPTQGTVKLTNSSNTVVGSGTLFDTELAPGNIVRVSGTSQDLRVHAITSAQTFISAIRPSSTITVGANLYIRSLYDDYNPSQPNSSYQNIYFDIWRNMIAAKRIQTSDFTHAALRYNWIYDTVYTEYDDLDPDLHLKQYYVVTSVGNVYKCIDNNNGGSSTVEPAGISNEIILMDDNYRWKYMFTLSSGRKLKFLTGDYIPVQTLTIDDSSDQWDVQSSAANGAINHIKILASGSNYLSVSNTFANVSSKSAFNLDPSSSVVDGTYTGSSLFISSGPGLGEVRKIVKYFGSNNYCEVNSEFSSLPTTMSTYIVSPTVTIRGDSNYGSKATAYVSNTFSGQVRKITIIDQGSSYSTANVTITANTSHGYGATARPIISPIGGHGSDPVDELNATNIIMNIRVSGAESNSFPTNNDFRLIGIVRDPLLANGSPATVSTLDQTTRVNVNEVSGDFVGDEVVVGLSSGAKGRLVYFAPTDEARTQGNLKLVRITTNGEGETFQVGEIVEGLTSTRTANVQSVTPGAMKKYSGIVIYTENRTPVIRALEQTEDVKIIINF